jgi:hypothetical protein
VHRVLQANATDGTGFHRSGQQGWDCLGFCAGPMAYGRTRAAHVMLGGGFGAPNQPVA